MAFNFNWSPLAADAEFYTRAQDMLTTALNKSPKPPIIVDDIIVDGLNLGSVPPELEILEIGDLAEDRFRGIFKMCYSGDAFLTLKTRVQANPLNTYLFSKPSFASPQPLAASSGLTIPIQITLSEIKLSAFIILVFSRQKGLTLVFRNDPLESLKVSSTFDSIPFVREYLQKEIEGQLRTLFMEDLPAIIHRLSLQMWCPETVIPEGTAVQTEQEQADASFVDPLASPPQDAVDAFGNVLDSSEISHLSLEGGSENTHSLFSQKNLLRLAALTDSQRTLSLFTPSIRDAVFRAWATPAERGDSNTTTTPSLSRTHSTLGSGGTTYTFADHALETSQHPTRPNLISLPSTTGVSLGSGRSSRGTHRKKKTRVVNLRKSKSSDTDTASESGESVTATESSYMNDSDSLSIPPRIPEEPEDNLVTPPRSPISRVRFRSRGDSIDLGEDQIPRRPRIDLAPPRPAMAHSTSMWTQRGDVPEASIYIPEDTSSNQLPQPEFSRHNRPTYQRATSTFPAEKIGQAPVSHHGIVEQAWMMKLAGELARRAHEQKVGEGGFWIEDRDDGPPPAYEMQR